MSRINIQSSDLHSLASNMQSWLGQMDSTRSQMVSRVRALESSWGDPQYHAFLDQLMMISNTLKTNTQGLERMRQQLQAMARNMDEEAQRFRRGMNSSM